MTATTKFTKTIPMLKEESLKLRATNAARNFVELMPKIKMFAMPASMKLTKMIPMFKQECLKL